MTFENIKESLNTKEYDFLRTNEHLGDNIILLGLGGSYAYGTNIDGVSDVDVRGVALNSKREILLGNSFDQVIDEATDTTVYAFDKIVKLLADGNPNVLEILFQPKNFYSVITPIGQELLDNRHIFLSKQVFYTFGGYARAQLRRLDNKSMRELSQGQQEVHILNSIKNASVNFPERYFEYPEDAIHLYVDEAVQEGYETEIFMDINLSHYPLRDWKSMWNEMNNIVKDYNKIGKRASNAILHNKVNKHAMHLVRLMKMCIEILKTGTFCTYRAIDHDLLMDIRNGKYMGKDGQLTPEFFAMVDALEKEMNEAFETSVLPDKPDKQKIDDFVYSVQERIIRDEIFNFTKTK